MLLHSSSHPIEHKFLQFLKLDQLLWDSCSFECCQRRRRRPIASCSPATKTLISRITHLRDCGAIGDHTMEYSDWRRQLQADSRKRIVNKITDTLKRHIPFSGDEGLQHHKKIAVMFEGNIYITATSQSDYLQKISLKMLTVETRSQNPLPDPMQFNSTTISVNPGSQGMEQVNSQGQQLSIPVQGSSSSYSALPPDSGLQQPTMPNVASQNSNLQNIQNMSGDWRAQLERKRTVNRMMDTLKKHLPFSGDKGLQEFKKIAERVEEEVYTAATSQSEYSRKICFMMLAMETRLQNPLLIAMQSKAAANSVNAFKPLSWQQEVFEELEAMKVMNTPWNLVIGGRPKTRIHHRGF